MRQDDPALDAFSARLLGILRTALPMDPETRELTPRLLTLSGRARRVLEAFSNALETAQAPGGTYAHVTAYASKAAELAARIAGALTLWEDLGAQELSAEAMAAGIELAQFYLSEASRLADAAIVSAEIEKAETLRKWLLASWPHAEILPGDVIQRAPIRALRESPAARVALAILEKHGWVVRLPEGSEVRGAMRKEAFRIVRAGDAL